MEDYTVQVASDWSEHQIQASIAISLKRIADAIMCENSGLSVLEQTRDAIKSLYS